MMLVYRRMALLFDFLLLFLLLLFMTFLFFAFPPRLLVDLLDGSQFFFQFHSPILEPDFYLSLRQTEGVSDFDTPSSRQVMVEVKFFFELERLEPCVRLPASSPWTAVGTCKTKNEI